MRKIMNKLILLVIPIICCMLLSSCDRDNEPNIIEDNQTNSGNNPEENNSNKPVNYYFRVETQVGNIRPEAGSLYISFNCNQSWSVSYNGDISGFSYSPSNGNGKGRISIKYDEVKYRETSNEISWNESGTLTFHIREGNSKEFKNTTYNVYISRRGNKMKV